MTYTGKILIISISAIISMATFCSCDKRAKRSADASSSISTSTTADARHGTATPTELPLPTIPQSITDPSERADWLALHFWDSYDRRKFAPADSLLLEQTFSNWLSVLPHSTPQGTKKAIDTMLRDEDPFAGFMMRLATKYLWQPDSPFYNEYIYDLFALNRIEAGDDAAERYEEVRREIARNAPGSSAPDFTVTGRDGNTLSFSTVTRGLPTALMFYEPECEQCHATIDALRRDTALTRALRDGNARLVLVYIGDDTESWKTHASTLPREWTVGIDSRRAIDDNELYSVRSTPTIYLIDPTRTIAAKNAPPASIPLFCTQAMQ